METVQQLVKRMFVDPARAEENLRKAAIEYVRALEAKQNRGHAPFERRI
jgi:hypothetical protein